MSNTDYSHTTRAKKIAGKSNAVFKRLNPYSAQGNSYVDTVSIKLGVPLGGCCDTPDTVPDAPTSISATAGNRQAVVSFAIPTDGGDPIVSYKVISSPGGIIATGTSSPITITGLDNGTTYTFTVVATNSVGDSVGSSSPPVIPATVPDAPTSVSATAGNQQATVSFAVPANGGSPITEYSVKSIPEGFKAIVSSSPVTITGLTNGISYTFTVVATNSIGDSVESSASSPVIPATAPNAPTAVSATSGNQQATVSFALPANGGSPITSYTVTSSPGGLTATGSSSPITVTGLTNGTPYTFTVVATNSVGNSVASSTSAPGTPATVPNAPTAVSATAGNQQATVSFIAPANGGSPITSYTVRSSPGNRTATGSSPITITGLTNGTPYTFTVVATNSVGNSVASSASTPVTPATVPNAPTAVSAVPGNQQATISFIAPANGGSPITHYTVTSSPGGFTATGSSPITITGLTNGTGYTFTVVATNSVGDSVVSSASSSVTPLPLELFTSGSGSWTAPSGVTSVTYLVVGGGGGGGSGGGTGAAGGGGGGSVKTGTLSVTPGVTYSYTIGNGGAAGTGAGPGIVGESSVFATITANGGGLGYGNYGLNETGNYGAGGSGQSGDTPTTGGSGGKVRDGATGNPSGVNTGAGGGGGGAGGNGVTSITSGGNVTNGGAGGPGVISNLRDGTNVTYGAGGRGGDETAGISVAGANGEANTGNGGSGATSSINGGAALSGGAGGSGIVVLTYDA
jgi:hypothetical protein